MSLRLTCITKLENSSDDPHKTVVFYCWENEETGEKGRTPCSEMIGRVKEGEIVYIKDTSGYRKYCFINKDEQGKEFLQAHSDNKPTDDLLTMIPWQLQVEEDVRSDTDKVQ